MKFGIHSWVLETQFPLIEAIEVASRIGYDGYEIDIGNFGGTGLGLQVLPDRMSDKMRQEIMIAREKAGITICSLCLGALWHYPLADNDQTFRRRGVEITTAAIDLANYLKADLILLPLAQPEGVSDTQALNNTLYSLEECIEIASESKITLGIENVCSNYLLSAVELAHLVDEFDSNYLKVYYDVANNSWMGFNPSSEIEYLGNRIARIHFKNRSSLRGSTDSITNSVGDIGIVDFEAVVKSINTIGYDGYLVVEVPTLGLNAEHIAINNLNSIKDLVF